MNEREILLYNALRGLHLLEKAPKADVLRDLCGLQAQFARNPMVSLWLRASDYAPDSWSDGLVKIWSHRGTLHTVPEEEIGLHLSAADILGPFEEGGWGLSAGQMARWAPFLIEEVRRGNDTRDGLKRACLAAGMEEAVLSRVFYGWGGLIKELCWRGRLALKPGTEKAFMVPESVAFIPRDEARMTLLRRYFEHFGPATFTDCRHFFLNWRAKNLHELFEALQPSLIETRMGAARYYHVLPLETEAALPECVLTPGFDQLVLGYRDRTRLIDEKHLRRLVNAQGIVFPAVIVRGQVRASWKIEGSRAVVTPFEHLLKRDEAAIRRAVRAKLSPAVRTTSFLPEP